MQEAGNQRQLSGKCASTKREMSVNQAGIKRQNNCEIKLE